MYEDTVRMLKKQKQLMQIEILQYKSLKDQGKRGIHSEEYYAKLGQAWINLKKAEVILAGLEDEVYNNFNYLES